MTWETSTTLDAIGNRLRESGRVLILTHQKPDGDALGSTLAVCRALEIIDDAPGKAATCWYAGPVPAWAPEIAGATRYKTIESSGIPDISGFGAVLVLDTGSWNQLEHFKEFLAPLADKTIIIDHHRNGDAEIADDRYIDTSAAAVCEPVAELCANLLGVPSARDLPPEVTEPLYLGIATDTGWFKHSNVTPRSLRLAADLLDAGARHAHLYEVTEQQERASRLAIVARALLSLDISNEGRVAIMSVSQHDREESKAGPGETGGIADIALSMRGVLVAALLSEVEAKDSEPARVKISLRSKEAEHPVDVNLVANSLGGGGHARAAGARVEGSLEQAVEIVRNAITAQLPS